MKICRGHFAAKGNSQQHLASTAIGHRLTKQIIVLFWIKQETIPSETITFKNRFASFWLAKKDGKSFFRYRRNASSGSAPSGTVDARVLLHSPFLRSFTSAQGIPKVPSTVFDQLKEAGRTLPNFD
jgi:hypothetical protein